MEKSMSLKYEPSYRACLGDAGGVFDGGWASYLRLVDFCITQL